MKKKIIITFLSILLICGVWGWLSVRSYLKVPTERLALDSFYPEMPPDFRHQYHLLPIDHRKIDRGSYKGFYILGPEFKKGEPVIFFLTDGQQELVGTGDYFEYPNRQLKGLSFVIIGRRGHAPTLFPEVFNSNGSIKYKAAMNLYGSDQHVEDIEMVRLDMMKKELLPSDGKIMLLGGSGAGVLLQQYLSKYGKNVSRASIMIAGAPDLIRKRGKTMAPHLEELNPSLVPRIDKLIKGKVINNAILSRIIFEKSRHAKDPISAQEVVVNDFEKNIYLALLKYWIKLSNNLYFIQTLFNFVPASLAAKVRMFELMSIDLRPYFYNQQKKLNLIYDWCYVLLKDFVQQAEKGKINYYRFNINRENFMGEMLVVLGKKDITSRVEHGQILKKSYKNSKFFLYDEGHRFYNNKYYQQMFKTFYYKGLNSKEFNQYISDPIQLNEKDSR